jgi:hypothetical protein
MYNKIIDAYHVLACATTIILGYNSFEFIANSITARGKKLKW